MHRVKPNHIAILLITLIWLTAACGMRAPRLPDGSKLEIHVVGNHDYREGQLLDAEIEQLDQVMRFSLRNLNTLFSQRGYEIRVLERVSDFVPRDGRYRLELKTVDYDPGNKATRLLVGYVRAKRTGFAALATHAATSPALENAAASVFARYRLRDSEGRLLLNELYDSSGEWKASIARNNRDALADITTLLIAGREGRVMLEEVDGDKPENPFEDW